MTKLKSILESVSASGKLLAPIACAAMLSACQSPKAFQAPNFIKSRTSAGEGMAPVVDAAPAGPSGPLPSPAQMSPTATPPSSRRTSPALPRDSALEQSAAAMRGDVRLVEHREALSPDTANGAPVIDGSAAGAPVARASAVSASLGPTQLGPALPPEAYTGYPGDGNTLPAYGGPLYQGPYGVAMPGMVGPGIVGPAPSWAPPGSARPFPPDEYIFDGGDRDLPVEVNADLSVRGLDQDDTVVHYDTIEGETIVKPSNRVCIYAPRFASVRRTYGVDIQEQHQTMLVIDKPEKLVSQELRLPPSSVVQPIEPAKQNGVDIVDTFEERLKGVEFDRVQTLVLASETLMPFEDLHFVRFGVADNAEKPRLAASIDAAITWTENQAVQVVVDEKQVDVEMGIESADTLVEIKRYGKPCVRICKLASTKAALPGDTIDFTLRFDNIGSDLANNVTIVDNLTTRLEYVPGTAQCTLAADFETEANDGETLVLKWKLKEQLLSGKGGVIRFKCRVR